MSNLIEATSETFGQEVLHASAPVLVDFYAPWCGPCRMLAPMLEKLADELAGRVKVVKVNVDDAGAVAEHYGITGVPTLMIFKGGQVVDTMVGLSSPRALVEKLKSMAPAAPVPVGA